ncbi:uncharacterized protein LOC128963367 [Oppia nitens]|uniref:uncharacterized protein LOC128963367 n=1 Tax=Oppia nitens TaxID=1686743 RepID=UPI0023DA1AB5|nr:uncharacterized protein LOC128963367 [Oppia nitens]
MNSLKSYKRCHSLTKCWHSIKLSPTLRQYYHQMVVPDKQIVSTEWSSKRIRNAFIDYFVGQHNHLRVQSCSVLPYNDPTLLFVSAGMNQFKTVFLNKLLSNDPMNDYRRVVNSQKCIRVGGKHCDLNNVGTDGRHHTFFEMLGNWSFGDYHKKESCHMAWDLLTNVYKLDPKRLIVTYFGGDQRLGLGPDLETKDIWLQIGLPNERVIPLGSKDNFWEMSETGPCGICTEIHYLLDTIDSCDVKVLMNNCIEIWNLVFIQFNRKSDGSLEPLHKHFVDTGMGLERIVSVIQNVKSNYETDLFLPYFHYIQNLSHCKPYGHSFKDSLDISYRILSDHSRMMTIAISDGLRPGYRGTGFILRKIIRKSIGIAANDFGISCPRQLLHGLSSITIELLGEAFPQLNNNSKLINDVIIDEIQKYESVVSDNKHLVKALNKINIKYSINLSQEIIQKLRKIREDIDIKSLDNSIDKEFIDTTTKYLFVIKDLISDYTINLRHNLPIELNQTIDDLLQYLDNYEKKLTQLFSDELLAIQSNNDFNHIIHKFKTIGDSSISFKIGLDLFGHKPMVLFHISPNGQQFYIQTSVPNEYQKYLKANDWLFKISSKLDNFELLSKKRTHKLSKLKSNSLNELNNVIEYADSFREFIYK